MNLAETNDLLTLIATYDNRRFDDATVVAWQPILANLRFDDCRAAVVEHFATSEKYLMPVHVRLGARDRARRRHEIENRLAIRAELEDPSRGDRSEATRELIRRLRDSLPDGDPDKLHRPEWVQHEKRRKRGKAEPNPGYDPTALERLASEEARRVWGAPEGESTVRPGGEK